MSKCAVLLAALGLLFSVATAQAADKDRKGDKRDKELDPALATQIRQVFDRLDGDKDGFLDKAELGRAFPNLKVKEAFLDSYDGDKDGKVSYAEFEDAAREYAEQMKKAQEQALKQLGNQRKLGGGRNAFSQLLKRYRR